MTLTNIIGIGGHALLLSATVLRLTSVFNLRRGYSYLLAVTAFIAVTVPVGAMPVAQVTRGIFGDMSITSLILLGYFFISPTSTRDKSRQLFILVIITGLLFYPAALGFGMLDPYQWGYLNSYRGIASPMLFLAALVGMMLIAARLNNDLILLCIAAAAGAFLIGAMESNNIWDYLIDPMIVIFGLFRIGIELTKHLIEKIRE
jgi:hypothetical protein